VIGLERDHRLEALHGLGKLPVVAQHVAEVVVRVDVAGLERNGLAIAFHRRRALAHGPQRVAQVAVVDLARAMRERGHDELHRARVVAFVIRDKPEQMQRVRVIRLHRENLPIDGRRFREAPRVLKREAAFDGRHGTCRRRHALRKRSARQRAHSPYLRR
jgi:hypothetical protein